MTRPPASDTSGAPACDLLADIGGTHTRVALAQDGAIVRDSARRYRNDAFDRFEAVLVHDLARRDQQVRRACVALAGPVEHRTGQLTNRDWRIDADGLRQRFGWPEVALINDLQAQALALSARPMPSHSPLVPGRAGAGPKLVVGIGTGFNTALCVSTGQGVVALAAETGHATLPCYDTRDWTLVQGALSGDRRATIEDALSGAGLARLYQACGGAPGLLPAQIIERETAKEGAAQAALALFVRTLGAVLRDLSLIHMPHGGIFLTGGVARAVARRAPDHGLTSHMRPKGRPGPALATCPVHVIDDDFAGLSGCARLLV